MSTLLTVLEYIGGGVGALVLGAAYLFVPEELRARTQIRVREQQAPGECRPYCPACRKDTVIREQLRDTP